MDCANKSRVLCILLDNDFCTIQDDGFFRKHLRGVSLIHVTIEAIALLVILVLWDSSRIPLVMLRLHFYYAFSATQKICQCKWTLFDAFSAYVPEIWHASFSTRKMRVNARRGKRAVHLQTRIKCVGSTQKMCGKKCGSVNEALDS